MTRRYRDDWAELAKREPYFAVLTDPRYLREHFDDDARRAFFASGEADVDALFALVRSHVPDFAPRSALDFGCGVGRLTIPLARRCGRATGVDIAPEMVAEARANASGVDAAFVTNLEDVSERFDFIASLIVFQHIPVSEGVATLTKLLRRLAPGGVAAIHMPLRRPGGVLRRIARRVRGAMPLVHRAMQRLQGDRSRLPYMQMNAYRVEEISRVMRAVTGAAPIVVPRNEGAIEGAIFLVRRP
ncbi:MAG TPA: class I SAM-dependent methyltransferase [Thermoanaerobaculia bacterium]|nr:class I SAM-dependent methyltransferase [Thermoanaerobaculia bacterium]